MKYDNEILRKARDYAAQNGRVYLKNTDGTFKAIKVIYIIVFCYTFCYDIISAFSFYSRNFVIGHAAKSDADIIASAKTYLILIFSFLALMAAAFVLSLIKQYFAALIISPIYTAGLLISFAKIMSEHIYATGLLDYFLQHGIALILLFILSLLLNGFGVRYKHLDKKSYLEYTAKEYEKQF